MCNLNYILHVCHQFGCLSEVAILWQYLTGTLSTRAWQYATIYLICCSLRRIILWWTWQLYTVFNFVLIIPRRNATCEHYLYIWHPILLPGCLIWFRWAPLHINDPCLAMLTLDCTQSRGETREPNAYTLPNHHWTLKRLFTLSCPINLRLKYACFVTNIFWVSILCCQNNYQSVVSQASRGQLSVAISVRRKKCKKLIFL